MAIFVLNKNQQANGDHEVHNKTAGGTYMPGEANQINLGEHTSCVGAVALAKKTYNDARINGCKYCCHVCHTT